MRPILLPLLFIFASNSQAQITVTQPDFADAGDTVRMSQTVDLTIDYTSTGANHTWDYSNLTPTGQVVKDYLDVDDASALVQIAFGFFAPPAYQATNYVASDAIPLDLIGGFLPVNISNVFQMSKNTSSEINSVGFTVDVEGTEVPFKSDTIETRYELPLNFGNVYSSNGYTNLDMNPIYNAIWRQYRTRNSNVDGWGSITTPYGTFDALRVRHDITEQDSLFFDLGGGGTWVSLPIPNSTIYEWWTNGEKEPILRIVTNEVLGLPVVSAIEYRDIYRNLTASVKELTTTFEMYPNPTAEELTIKGLQPGSSYTVFDANGRLVSSGSATTTDVQLNVASFESGTYTVMVRNGEGKWSSASFVKK